MQIFYLPKFKRQFKKIPDDLRILAKKRITIFIENSFDTRLKTHKLHGGFSDFYSFSVDSKI
ncbi:MAG: type II toxin-antitoxin system mRNA interferase toxin, RelE/StbE family, partial [Candidatus Vogelbacteria bacterium]|nr:type II toxin-antitoxin system mRNA interferase toxin, RelE/StbE family [Candidatus Vogelbacteria bacterium]